MSKETVKETANDYPMMTFISKVFDVLAIINIVGGLIFFVFSIFNGEFFFGIAAVIISGFAYGFCKLISEGAKILSDIANNVKAIRLNSDSWSK
jgi:hypothetical protein